MSLREPLAWSGPSSDPKDEQFGDIVEPTSLDDADDFDAVLVGEPYDGAVIGRHGAREGPTALRKALAGVKTHHLDWGPVESVGDCGDLVVPDESVSAVQESIHEVTNEIHTHDTLPVFLGGDNSLTYPNAAPLLTDSLGVLNVDAHLDCREVHDEPTSGTAYRQLHESGLGIYVCVGARHFETSTVYAEYVRDRGGTIVSSEAVGDSPTAAAKRALDAMDGVDMIYVSVDLDVLDVVAAPGVSAPTPGGISTRELFSMLRTIAIDDRVAGFEVVECAPPFDIEGRTAAAGARAIAHFLSGYEGGHQ